MSVGRPELREAASRAEIGDLWGKLRASKRAVPSQILGAMRKMAQLDGRVDPEEAAALREFAEAYELQAWLQEREP